MIEWNPSSIVRLNSVYSYCQPEKSAVLFFRKMSILFGSESTENSIRRQCQRLGMKPKVISGEKCSECSSVAKCKGKCMKCYKRMFYQEYKKL